MNSIEHLFELLLEFRKKLSHQHKHLLCKLNYSGISGLEQSMVTVENEVQQLPCKSNFLAMDGVSIL